MRRARRPAESIRLREGEFYPAAVMEQYAARFRLRAKDVEFPLLEGELAEPHPAIITDKIMASGNFFQRPAVMLTLALASVAGLVTLMGRLANGPQVAQKRVQLSAGEQSEAYPAISPDGKRIAYSARESSKVSAFHVFVRELPSGKPQQLTHGEGSDVAPVWSPDGGAVAFLRVADGLTQCIRSAGPLPILDSPRPPSPGMPMANRSSWRR